MTACRYPVRPRRQTVADIPEKRDPAVARAWRLTAALFWVQYNSRWMKHSWTKTWGWKRTAPRCDRSVSAGFMAGDAEIDFTDGPDRADIQVNNPNATVGLRLGKRFPRFENRHLERQLVKAGWRTALAG